MSENNVTGETKSVSLRWSSEQKPEICTAKATSEATPLRRSGREKNDLLHIVLYVILKSGRSVTVVSRISVRSLFAEEARALGLLAFVTIAERVAGEVQCIAASPRVAVCMRSGADDETCANVNLRLRSLFVEASGEFGSCVGKVLYSRIHIQLYAEHNQT